MDKQTTIRLRTDTKQYLDSVKLISHEPYDQVIRRLLTCFVENNEDSIDRKTAWLVNERIRNVKSGKVLSTDDLRKRLFKKPR